MTNVLILEVIMIAILVYFLGLEVIHHSKKSGYDRNISGFISSMSKWALVKKDILFIMERGSEKDFEEPFKSASKEFVTRVKSGILAEEAIGVFTERFDSDFIAQMKVGFESIILHGGDISTFLTKLERESFKAEEVMADNLRTLSRDLISLAGLSFVSGVMSYMLYSAGKISLWMLLLSASISLFGIIVALRFSRRSF